MSKLDPIAEQFSDWLDAPPEALARIAGPLAADVQIATQVRHTLTTMQPDAQFIAQLEARLLASADQQPNGAGRPASVWFSRLRNAITASLRTPTAPHTLTPFNAGYLGVCHAADIGTGGRSPADHAWPQQTRGQHAQHTRGHPKGIAPGSG